MKNFSRRTLLKASGLSFLSPFFPLSDAFPKVEKKHTGRAGTPVTTFLGDGEMMDPATYISRLQQIQNTRSIHPDRYGAGGVVEELEKKFAAITGKERAVFMPTGTMANQLAIKVLSGEKAKVFVQETSHYYRDEADAAPAVHNKRLIPLAKGEPYFMQEELEQAVLYHKEGEVFGSEAGAVSIEIPVRRSEGQMIPFEELKKIAHYCRENKIPLHLDGARLYMASAWSGVSIKDYASLFDTVYISLYKYLGASAGAVLSGSNEVMDKMGHLIKIYGGSMYRNWTNAAMALHKLENFESRLQMAREKGEELFALLNGLPQLKVKPLKNGTNIYDLQLTGIDIGKLAASLNQKRIQIGRSGKLTINETILYQDTETLFHAFNEGVKRSKA
jgi:threonine aldolase